MREKIYLERERVSDKSEAGPLVRAGRHQGLMGSLNVEGNRKERDRDGPRDRMTEKIYLERESP